LKLTDIRDRACKIAGCDGNNEMLPLYSESAAMVLKLSDIAHVFRTETPRIALTYNSEVSFLQYNGDVVFPGTTADGVTFTRTTHFLTVSFDFGLVIRWDGVDR